MDSSRALDLKKLRLSTLDPRLFFANCFISPGHPWSVVGNADVAFRVQHDNSAVAVQSLFQIVHRLLRGPLPVSYTHLDVYKRQRMESPALGRLSGILFH